MVISQWSAVLSFVLLVLLCPGSTLSAQGSTPRVSIGAEVRLGGGLAGDGTPRVVLSPDFQSVPIHPDDGRLDPQRRSVIHLPIPETDLAASNGYSEISVAPHIKVMRLRLQAGVTYKGRPQTVTCHECSGRERYPPFDAYVFYRLDTTLTSRRWGYYGEVEYSVNPIVGLSFGLREESYEYSLRLRRGWDRFSRQETWRTDDLGTVLARRVSPYLGVTLHAPESDAVGALLYLGPSLDRGTNSLVVGAGVHARRTGLQLGAVVTFRAQLGIVR